MIAEVIFFLSSPSIYPQTRKKFYEFFFLPFFFFFFGPHFELFNRELFSFESLTKVNLFLKIKRLVLVKFGTFNSLLRYLGIDAQVQ